MKLTPLKEQEILDEIREDIKFGRIYEGGVWIRLDILHKDWRSHSILFGAMASPSMSFNSDDPDELATTLFDLSMGNVVYKFDKKRGGPVDKGINGFGHAVVGYIVGIGPAHNLQTNLSGDIVETFVELMEDALECAGGGKGR